MELASKRLSTIGMGFAVCIFTSLLIFPMWASDEFHDSTASKFQKLAGCIEGCLEEYFRLVSEKETGPPSLIILSSPFLWVENSITALGHTSCFRAMVDEPAIETRNLDKRRLIDDEEEEDTRH